MPDKSTIMVTGAAGLLGHNFIQWLLKNTDHYVIGVDAMYDWGNHNVIPNDGHNYQHYDFFNLDITSDEDKLDGIIQITHVKTIYHFASYAAEGLSPFMRKFNYMQNTIASANIINLAIKHNCKVIFTSSMSVYGHGRCLDGKAMFDENDKPEPIDPYAISKYGIEQDLKVAGTQHGLDWIIIRPHNVFGIGQNVNDRYRNVIGIWMHQAVIGEPLTIYGDGEQERSFTYIDNILEPLYKAKDLHHKIINLGGIKGISINDACKAVMKITGAQEMVHLEARHEVKRAIPDPSRSIIELQYKDIVGFEDGLKRMWEWVKDTHQVHDWYTWDMFELDKGIYSYWKK